MHAARVEPLGAGHDAHDGHRRAGQPRREVGGIDRGVPEGARHHAPSRMAHQNSRGGRPPPPGASRGRAGRARCQNCGQTRAASDHLPHRHALCRTPLRAGRWCGRARVPGARCADRPLDARRSALPQRCGGDRATESPRRGQDSQAGRGGRARGRTQDVEAHTLRGARGVDAACSRVLAAFLSAGACCPRVPAPRRPAQRGL
mmetsp:Transcript_93343/g.267064  ORF Transcript_93343/g.267064 Transcript_93343/m.267064 type:complete len:203 (+) Transcript_93343:563-1171(+)